MSKAPPHREARRPVSTPPLVQLSWRRETLVVRVRGSLDGDSYQQLDEALAEAESSTAQRILLDLDRANSLDARTLHVILKASRRSAHNGHRLQVTRGRGHVADVVRSDSPRSREPSPCATGQGARKATISCRSR